MRRARRRDREIARVDEVLAGGDLEHLRVLEDRNIKIHGFLGLIVEPQEGGDFLHGLVLERRASEESLKGIRVLCGGQISSIVYTVHKRIAKIMNAVHINK
jgi:hypothetical protein